MDSDHQPTVWVEGERCGEGIGKKRKKGTEEGRRKFEEYFEEKMRDGKDRRKMEGIKEESGRNTLLPRYKGEGGGRSEKGEEEGMMELGV